MKIKLNLDSLDDYELFLRVKLLPTYRFVGRVAEFPDCYAERLGIWTKPDGRAPYAPARGLFDYQEFFARLMINREKFAMFARPGLGKTFVMAETALHAFNLVSPMKKVLICSPLMIVDQTIEEIKRFYGDQGIHFPIERVTAKDLPEWTQEPGSHVGITNYEALTDDVDQGLLAYLAADESQIMKNAYGVRGNHLVRLGAGLRWKYCFSGTPAPNDRIEYGQTAVFLDAFPTINSFLSRYFVNRGQTQDRWDIKPHALGPFYTALSHWCCFLNSPTTYGFKDNADTIPPIHVHIHDVELTPEQNAVIRQTLGTLVVTQLGGIVTRAKLSQISKGSLKGKKVATNKFQYIRSLVDSWPDESTIVWCAYEAEQQQMEEWFPEAGSIKGSTKHDKRADIIRDFKSGKCRVLISKPDLCGLGLNFQIATRQVFSACTDSYEDWTQCIMRSNRVGSTRPLNVHVPVTDIERVLLENVLRKAKRVEEDMQTQERLFKQRSVWGRTDAA